MGYSADAAGWLAGDRNALIKAGYIDAEKTVYKYPFKELIYEDFDVIETSEGKYANYSRGLSGLPHIRNIDGKNVNASDYPIIRMRNMYCAKGFI